MNTRADKTQENKSQSMANAVSQKQSSGESTFQFVDNRPKAIAQRKLQEMANNSPRVGQLKAFQAMANNSQKVKQADESQAFINIHPGIALQRKIDYSKESSTVQNNGRAVDSDEQMLEFLIGQFGEERREYLVAQLREEATRTRNMTPFQFYTAILGVISSQTKELPPSQIGRPKMPSEFQQVKDFAVTDGTILFGSVGKTSIPMIKNVKRGRHAERIFIDTVEKLEEVDLTGNPQITITINNSPCNARCAGMLARWVKKHKLTNVTVFFANPHGFDERSREDHFSRARVQLRGAGIRVEAFEPRDFISESSRSSLRRGRGRSWGKRYDVMKKRRDRARALGRFDSEDEVSDEGSRSRSPVRKQSQERRKSRSRSREKQKKVKVSRRNPRFEMPQLHGTSLDYNQLFEEVRAHILSEPVVAMTGYQVAELVRLFGPDPAGTYVHIEGVELIICKLVRPLPKTKYNPTGLALGMRRYLRGG